MRVVILTSHNVLPSFGSIVAGLRSTRSSPYMLPLRPGSFGKSLSPSSTRIDLSRCLTSDPSSISLQAPSSKPGSGPLPTELSVAPFRDTLLGNVRLTNGPRPGPGVHAWDVGPLKFRLNVGTAMSNVWNAFVWRHLLGVVPESPTTHVLRPICLLVGRGSHLRSIAFVEALSHDSVTGGARTLQVHTNLEHHVADKGKRARHFASAEVVSAVDCFWQWRGLAGRCSRDLLPWPKWRLVTPSWVQRVVLCQLQLRGDRSPPEPSVVGDPVWSFLPIAKTVYFRFGCQQDLWAPLQN